jgi:hypothetical protein
MSAKKPTLKDISHTPPTGEPVRVWERGRKSTDDE